MSFKLLAIRPLEGCHTDFLKNLEENRIYQFYNDYEFLDKNDKAINDFQKYVEVAKIVHNPTVPENLYCEDENEPKVNISAIVGKNGSGKSTLVELLYAAVYNLAIQLKLIKGTTIDKAKNKRLKKEIKALEGIKLLLEKNNTTKETNKIVVEILKKEIINRKLDFSERIKRKKISNLNLELFYRIKNEYFVLIFKNNRVKYEISIDKIFNKKYLTFLQLESQDPIEKMIYKGVKSFFYNIVVNYSLYGLNSEEVGDWINPLFHKNDAYQTPIVINPMRNEGDIDINSETFLSKQRFLLNLLLNETLVLINENQKICKIHFKYLNKSTYGWKLFGSNDIKLVKDNVLNEFFDLENVKIEILETDLNKIICTYINDKIKKIAKTYNIYKNTKVINIFLSSTPKENIDLFFFNLKKDNSHIAFKLKQALNFLFFNNLEGYNEDEIYTKLSKDISTEVEIPIGDFAKRIEKIENNDKYFLDKNSNKKEFYLPPSFLDIDYEFEGGGLFSMLSSGERQQIYSVNSILYHLINLESAFNNLTKYKYPYINLVLDEIELYAHPEMQRTFLKNLLDGIKKLELKNIKGINIQFITHSPFILSDIPKQNVLFLEVDDKTKKATPKPYKEMNTFGANITDLLADSFFIGNGLIGEYAKEKIEESIKWMNQILEKRKEIRKLELEDNKNNYSVIEELKNDLETLTIDELNINKDNKKYKKFHKTINLIDENFLRIKLLEMYNEALPIENERKKELELLEKLAKKHNKNISDA